MLAGAVEPRLLKTIDKRFQQLDKDGNNVLEPKDFVSGSGSAKDNSSWLLLDQEITRMKRLQTGIQLQTQLTILGTLDGTDVQPGENGIDFLDRQPVEEEGTSV